MICFDVTEQQTFNNVKNWVESIEQHADKRAARILVGNKVDLVDERKVTREEAEQMAQKFGISYHETSAKANIGMSESFEDIFEQSYRNKFGSNSAVADKPDARGVSMKLNAKPAK